ncbi:MAG: SRPBCC family protein [Acidimicrobiales bacterium]|jgi:hypothetical protein
MPAQRVSVERTIMASPAAIFDLLADPSKHGVIDGSGTVQGHRGAQTRLALGARFGMNMKLAVRYHISNTVVEFEEPRLIAWAHFGKHRWRYELEAGDENTLVRETFDWSTASAPVARFIELVRYPQRHLLNMDATLERLAQLVEPSA